MSARHVLFATAPQGLEDLLAAELSGMGLGPTTTGRGGVTFEADLAGAYRACLWSRVANRVLLPLAEFSVPDDDALYTSIQEIQWLDHLGPDNSLAVDFTGIRPAIAHGRFAAQRVKDAIVDQLREHSGERPSVDIRNPDVRIHLHLHGEQGNVAIDLSGDSLHKRGVRDAGVAAPLKENLAAAVLLRADWPELAAAGSGFVDPMCGSGTIAIEAAWMAADCAPGLMRTRYGFQRWRGHDDEVWKALVDEAIDRQEAGLDKLPPMAAFDHDRRAVYLTRQHLEHAGLTGRVHVERRDIGEARPPAKVRGGLVAVNPPYGERIGEQHELLPLYLRLGDTLRRHFPGWRAMVLNGAGCRIGLKPERTWQVRNGPIECSLERFEIGMEASDSSTQPAEDLVNRILKNRRQLRRWLERENIHSYRVYDADIPEYALAVDVYGAEEGDWLHVQEYEPPATVDPVKARARLQGALTSLPQTLDVPPERMVFKVRRRQRGSDQYTRQSQQSKMLTVTEGRCRLIVNLTDYLDTGLFLDHRPVRLWLADNSRGKRLLNLFCYTGAATVHAAVGGASHTTSVDLSNTYLDWLKRNLELNGCADLHHRIVHADCREWLERNQERFDLIFLDPPSFSNSKRMDGTLDIQRDHADLIRKAACFLNNDGTLIFSTNLRGFRLDDALKEEFDINDRSTWSIPKDFERNRRIHRCWFLQRR